MSAGKRDPGRQAFGKALATVLASMAEAAQTFNESTATQFASPKQIAERLGMSAERVRQLCRRGSIVGAERVGVGVLAFWRIPVDRHGNPATVNYTPGRPGPRPKPKEREP